MFLLNILNGLSPLKYLSRRFRIYLPMLMLVSFQNSGLNQITLIFLFLPRLFEWLLSVSPTLTSVQVPHLLLLPLELEFTGFTYSSLHWNPLFLRASSYLLLLSSKIILHEYSLFILWFTVSIMIFGGLIQYFCRWGGIALTKRFEGAVI